MLDKETRMGASVFLHSMNSDFWSSDMGEKTQGKNCFLLFFFFNYLFLFIYLAVPSLSCNMWDL